MSDSMPSFGEYSLDTPTNESVHASTREFPWHAPSQPITMEQHQQRLVWTDHSLYAVSPNTEVPFNSHIPPVVPSPLPGEMSAPDAPRIARLETPAISSSAVPLFSPPATTPSKPPHKNFLPPQRKLDLALHIRSISQASHRSEVSDQGSIPFPSSEPASPNTSLDAAKIRKDWILDSPIPSEQDIRRVLRPTFMRQISSDTAAVDGHEELEGYQAADSTLIVYDDVPSDQDSSDDEDPDQSLLYLYLSTSQTPSVRKAWEEAKLVLVPPRSALPSEMERHEVHEEWERFVSLHALRPSTEVATRYYTNSSLADGTSYEANVDPYKSQINVYPISRQPPLPEHNRIPSSSLPPVAERFDTSLHPPARTTHGESPILQNKRSTRSFTLSSLAETLPSPQLHQSSRRILEITGETPVYRRTAKFVRPKTSSMSLTPSLYSVAESLSSKRESKPRFRTPKWIKRMSSFSKDSSKEGTAQRDEAAPLEKIRILQINQPIVEWRNLLPPQSLSIKTNFATLKPQISNPLLSNGPLRSAPAAMDPVVTPVQRTFDPAVHNGLLIDLNLDKTPQVPTRPRPPKREASNMSQRSMRNLHTRISTATFHQTDRTDFASDLVFLLDPPPAYQQLSLCFTQALVRTMALCQMFSASFVYVSGYDDAVVQRLKAEVVHKVWHEVISPELSLQNNTALSEDLMRIIENVTMAFVYPKLYDAAILPLYSTRNQRFNSIIHSYGERSVSLLDFKSDVHPKLDLSRAIATVTELCGPTHSRHEIWERIDAKNYQKLFNLIGETRDAASTVLSLLEVQTPSDCIVLMRRCIDEVVRAIEEVQGKVSAQVSTDDLLPLLAWTMVQAKATNAQSLLFFIQHFRLSRSYGADYEWALVTFDAAVAYLATDPLPEMPATLNALRHLSMGSTSLPRTLGQQRARPAFGHTRTMSFQRETRQVQPEPSANDFKIAFNKARARSSSLVDPPIKREENMMPPPPLPSRRLASAHSPILPASASMPASPTTSSVGHESLESGSNPSATLLDRRRSSSIAAGPLTSEVQYQPQIFLRGVSTTRPSIRQVQARENSESSSSTYQRPPLGRSRSSHSSHSGRGIPIAGASSDMKRSDSDGTAAATSTGRRLSVEWSSLFGVTGPASPTSSNSPATSPLAKSVALDRSGSVSSSLDLDRSESEGWWSWSRKRLSSMTTATSLVESDNHHDGIHAVPKPPTSPDLASQSEEAVDLTSSSGATEGVTRRRAHSISTDSQPRSSFESAGRPDLSSISERLSSPRTLHESRPKSTISLSSLSSLDTEATGSSHHGSSSFPTASPNVHRALNRMPSRNRRTREFMAAPLPPRLDVSTIMSVPVGATNSPTVYGKSHRFGFPSPIHEIGSPPRPARSPSRLGRSRVSYNDIYSDVEESSES